MPEIWKVIITILSVSCGVPMVLGCTGYAADMIDEGEVVKGLALIGAAIAVAMTVVIGLIYLWMRKEG